MFDHVTGWVYADAGVHLTAATPAPTEKTQPSIRIAFASHTEHAWRA
jgi:hypothetical protein